MTQRIMLELVSLNNMAQSIYFKRLKKEVEAMSPYLRFVRIKYGFWRIFEKGTYLHEVYEEMPYRGYDITEENPNLFDKKYFEEREDKAELIRRIKNFKEGYIDSKNRIKTRFYMLKNDKEFRETARRSHRVFHVK